MTMVARVYRAPSLQQQDLLPVSTLDEAIRSLVCLRASPDFTDAAYDACVRLVADIFWVSDLRLRRDVLVLARQIGVQ